MNFKSAFFAIIIFSQTIANRLKNNSLTNKSIGLFLKKIFDIIFIFAGKYKLLFTSIVYSVFFQLLAALSIFFFALSLQIQIYFLNLIWINALTSIILILPILLNIF